MNALAVAVRTAVSLVPSESIIRDVLVRVDPGALDLALQQWNAAFGEEDRGSSVKVSIRPASESATVGCAIKLADPVSRKRPGRRSSSTLFLWLAAIAGRAGFHR